MYRDEPKPTFPLVSQRKCKGEDDLIGALCEVVHALYIGAYGRRHRPFPYTDRFPNEPGPPRAPEDGNEGPSVARHRLII